MQAPTQLQVKSLTTHILGYLFIAIGAFITAFAIAVFLLPNNIIDGGVVGIAMIGGQVFGKSYFPYFFIVLATI